MVDKDANSNMIVIEEETVPDSLQNKSKPQHASVISAEEEEDLRSELERAKGEIASLNFILATTNNDAVRCDGDAEPSQPQSPNHQKRDDDAQCDDDMAKLQEHMRRQTEELLKVRQELDVSQQQHAVLSNRLNEARKGESTARSQSNRFESKFLEACEELKAMQEGLQIVTKERDSLKTNADSLKGKCIKRVEQTERALDNERKLNEERKAKMKVFVQTKGEELRTAQESAEMWRTDLDETRVSLRQALKRIETQERCMQDQQKSYEALKEECKALQAASQKRNRKGDSLEWELHQSTLQAEEHKNKRLTAKNELLALLKQLEVERAINHQLRNGIKLNILPKASSQSQKVAEAVERLETQLQNLVNYFNVITPPRDESSPNSTSFSNTQETIKGSPKDGSISNAEGDAAELISELEADTDRTSSGVEELLSGINSMEHLIRRQMNQGEETCISTFSRWVLDSWGELPDSSSPSRTQTMSPNTWSRPNVWSPLSTNSIDEDDTEERVTINTLSPNEEKL
eukprot:scaffold24007_cov49-Attheya_sp.AAC.2